VSPAACQALINKAHSRSSVGLSWSSRSISEVRLLGMSAASSASIRDRVASNRSRSSRARSLASGAQSSMPSYASPRQSAVQDHRGFSGPSLLEECETALQVGLEERQDPSGDRPGQSDRRPRLGDANVPQHLDQHLMPPAKGDAAPGLIARWRVVEGSEPPTQALRLNVSFLVFAPGMYR
jgi:hypothetical protein